MVKKFKEFNESIDIGNIISYDEVEDQFLRLKEVLGYEVIIYYHKYKNNDNDNPSNFYTVQILNNESHNIEEFKQIKRRIEAIYPTLKAFFVSASRVGNTYCYICNKDNIIFSSRLEELINSHKFEKVLE